MAPPMIPRPRMPTGGFRFFMRRRYYAGMRIRAVLFSFLIAWISIPIGAWAQAWPAKPIRMLVPFPPGGGVDYAARIVGKHLSDRLRHPVLDRKRTRANGMHALEGPSAAPPAQLRAGGGTHRA